MGNLDWVPRHLTKRQLIKMKFMLGAATLIFCTTFMAQYYVEATNEECTSDDDKCLIKYNDQEWSTQEVVTYDRGQIVYLAKPGASMCTKWALIPGLALYPAPVLAIAYFLTLSYLFFGIAIVADIFMNAIEQIASTKVMAIFENDGHIEQRPVNFWNATVANLTLMALGSSAPEIILAVLETSTSLGSCPGELGASTIVGSAAFNLLVISGISVYAVAMDPNKAEDYVDPETGCKNGYKKIKDMGVFSVTAFFSIFAYIWLWIVLLDMEIEVWEAVVTFAFFPILVGIAYFADYMNGENKVDDQIKIPAIALTHNVTDFYTYLLPEKAGDPNLDQSEEAKETRKKMRETLKEHFNHDNIEEINKDELKNILQGDSLISRIKYRKQVGASNVRPELMKGQIYKFEHEAASHIDDADKNDNYGFKCLHYSVSESSKTIKIEVLNKKKTAGTVIVKTQDGTAISPDDYIAFHERFHFAKGQESKIAEITIVDDEGWEPDEDFFVLICDAEGKEETLLPGKDTKTKVTIIDDDKPGQVGFEQTKGMILALANTGEAEVKLVRKNGSDGLVTVYYETFEIDTSDHTATHDVDYKHVEGYTEFEDTETEKSIMITILQKPEDVQRDEAFGIRLKSIQPNGAKLSKKNTAIVNIITDEDRKKKEVMFAQLLDKIVEEEKITWGKQFVKACMLHPSKNEDGEIEPVQPFDAFLHFVTIGWKLFFSLIPPPHMCGGWACFVIALAFIGMVTYVVQAIAEVFGCVLGILPSVTAITFVALGTSLPDTFASMIAAKQEQYADAAVGNVTGSNSVNVFLGLGLPWVLAVIYEQSAMDKSLPESEGKNGRYFVPAGALGFSVVVFVACALICIFFLVVRRCTVGGELGGGSCGRIGSAAFLVSLWFVYIILCILQAYKIGGLDKLTFGIKVDLNHRCNKPYYVPPSAPAAAVAPVSSP